MKLNSKIIKQNVHDYYKLFFKKKNPRFIDLKTFTNPNAIVHPIKRKVKTN